MLARPAGGVFGLLPMATPRDRIKRTRKGQKLTAWWVSWLAERHSNDRKIGCMNLLYPREDYRMNNAVSAWSSRLAADIKAQILRLLRDEAPALPKPLLAFVPPLYGIGDELGPGETGCFKSVQHAR